MHKAGTSQAMGLTFPLSNLPRPPSPVRHSPCCSLVLALVSQSQTSNSWPHPLFLGPIPLPPPNSPYT